MNKVTQTHTNKGIHSLKDISKYPNIVLAKDSISSLHNSRISSSMSAYSTMKRKPRTIRSNARINHQLIMLWISCLGSVNSVKKICGDIYPS